MTDVGGSRRREEVPPPSSPMDDLAVFADKRLVIVGGYGSGGALLANQQWRSMWDAFKMYGGSGGGDPPKEEIERSKGCNYYCGDCHALAFAKFAAPPPPPPRRLTTGSTAAAAASEWSRLDFGREASLLLQRTGHTLTSLQAGGELLLFGGHNLQRGDGVGAPSASLAAACAGFSAESGGGGGGGGGGVPTCCTNDAWLLELSPDGHPPTLRELAATGPPPTPRAHHTATLLGDTLYVVGGVCESMRHEAPLRDVHALHLPSRRWFSPVVGGTPPNVLARHSAAAHMGQNYVYGGSLRLTDGKPPAGGAPRARALLRPAAHAERVTGSRRLLFVVVLL